MQHRREVHIECYNSIGEFVLRQVFTKGEWYDQVHPIIDSDSERVRTGVVEIRGRQYDSGGNINMEWITFYDTDGSILEMREQRSDGTSDVRRWRDHQLVEHIQSENRP